MTEEDASNPISPDPVLEWQPDFIPAYLSNGMIGLRASPIPLFGGVAIVDGLASIQADEQVEGFARAPYPVGGDLEIDGYSLRRLPARAQLLEQVYDFSCGELRTRFSFAGRDARALVHAVTYCSRTQPTLAVQELSVEVDQPCRLRLSAIVDPTEVPGSWKSRETEMPGQGNPLIDGCLLWEPPGRLTTCGAAYHTLFEGPQDATKSKEDRNRLAPLTTSYELRAAPGSTYRLHHLTSLLSSQSNHLPHREATRLASAGGLIGFERLRAANRRAWRDIWRSRVKLVGADRRWQAIADAAQYYLHASAHPSSLFSTAMFGLAYWPNYHYYRGQVMWDVELFALPPLLLTQPPAAAALLDFRRRGLEAAELNAAINGYQGMQYPWAAGPLSGQEAVRTDAPLVSLEQHVSLCVAHAFSLYANVTGDADFRRDAALPVVAGVARWIESRAESTERGLEFRRVLGFAEGRTQPVDNSGYFNMAAAVVLREAAELTGLLGRLDDARRWALAADRVFVPVERRGGIVLNHEHFTPEEGGVVGATPEALAGIFPFGYRLEPEICRKTIAFYLGRVEPYVGYPMMNAPLGVFAAWLGDRQRSAELFEAGYGDYINQPYLETDEFSRTRYPERPVVGPFFANLGGFLLSCMYGLSRMQPNGGDPASWFQGPITMPELWEAIEVDEVWVRERPAVLSARHGHRRGELAFS